MERTIEEWPTPGMVVVGWAWQRFGEQGAYAVAAVIQFAIVLAFALLLRRVVRALSVGQSLGIGFAVLIVSTVIGSALT